MYHQKKHIATNGNRLYGLLYSMLLLLIQVNGFSQGGSPSANIDQGNNGKLSAPNDPVVWINGNLNTTKSHYIESQSIPYRIKMDNLPLGVPITIRVGFDIRESGHYAIDYLTSYDWTSIHSFIFKHPDEVVDPELEMMAMFSGKVYAPLPNPGKKNSPADWSTQPEASYNHVASQGKNQMTLINGTFVSNPSWVSGKEPDYSELNDKYEVQMDVTFVASAMPVIVAFGGHIASRYDWGTLPNLQARSAGGLPGSPYHMRIVDLRYNGTIKSIGSQDLSLQIDAPNCNNLALSISSQQNLLCNGVGGGSVTLGTSGGNPGFQFSIDTGRTYQTSNVFSGLAPGSYQFLVRDTIGCVFPISTTITEPPVIVKSGKATNVLCYGEETGAIDLSVSGGTPGYTYVWSNGATSQDLSGVAAGTYIVTITDAGQCMLKDTFQITQPSAALSVSGKSTDVLCYGDKTGSIDLSVSGGTKDYVYAWSNGESTEDISGLSAGVYSVLITDANGCEQRDTFTIGQPSSALSVGLEKVDVKCYGDASGSINLTVSGGTSPYAFSWSNGSTDEDLSDLKAGTYHVLVTDDNGCEMRDTIAVSQPDAALSIKHSKVDVLCYGQSTGSIDLSVAGGSPEYTFSWSNGASTEDLNELSAGTYKVIVTDAQGCIIRDSAIITQPSAALSVSGKSTDVLCYGDKTGSIDLSVSGGTKDYVYAWSNGESTEDISGLSAGVYSVLITDANGCEQRDTFTIGQPSSALSVGLEKVDVKCYGDASGSINLTVSGGTSPYAFIWSNGSTDEDLSDLKAGTYHVLVTDDNGCEMRDTIAVSQPASGLSLSGKITDVLCKGDQTGSIDITVSGGTPSYQFSWSSGEDTEDISGKAAGIYYVLITDANQCELKDTFEIEEPAEKLSVSGIVADLKCYNDGTGGIDITVSGGTMSYVYEWSTGAVTEDLTGIAAGTYTVTVTDKNGCSAKETFVVKQPEPLIVQADNNKVCAGKPIALTASPSGGTWTGTGVSGSEFMMPYAGTFNVVYTYTNLSGCKGIDTAQITVENCELDYCTYTQGYYGNAGGKACSEGEKYTTLQLIQKALGKGTIVLGNPTFNKTFTIAYGDAATLISILPGGGSPTALSYTGNRTPSTLPSSMLKNGKINNVLLSQTITLALNVRINQGMDSFQLRSDKYLMTQDVVSCGSNDLKECSYHSYRLSEKVVNALNGNRTVSDLLKLANNALAGSLPMGVSYGDVAKAVDLLNNAYDGCRYGWYSDTVVYCADQDLYSSASNLTANEPPIQVNVEQGSRQPSVKAFPNPFEDMVRFTIESPESIQCNLMLYTASGKLISKVFDGRVEANAARTVQFMVPSIYKGAIMYVLSYNGKMVTGKILKK